MTQIRLPNGTVIDFKDADQTIIEKSLKNLRSEKPEFFTPKKKEINYSTASFEEIAERGRTKKGVQTSEDQGPPLTHPELEVADAGFQYFYGKADNDAERTKRLVSIFG